MRSIRDLGTLVYPGSTLQKGEFMNSFKTDDKGFTGLEAAIVLIAFVVVAAVFSYVVLGAGFFTTQKAQETVYKGVEQSTANLMLKGSITGLSTDNLTITSVTFPIGTAPGAQPIDLTKLKIQFQTPNTNPVILTQGTTASNSTFTTKIGSTAVTSLSSNDQVEIAFLVDGVSANTKMIFELRPSVGAAVGFTRDAPATITATNDLH